MAGIITARYDRATKGISIGQLDQFMDWMINQQSGEIAPQDALTIALSFRAVDLIAGAVSRMPYGIYRGETEVTDKYTPRYWADLNYKLCMSYVLFNEAYCLKESNQFGANEQWRFLVSPAMKIKTHPVTNQLTGFEYNNQPIPDYEKTLLWWWWPNILAEVGPGSGPTNAALDDLALVNYLTEFATAYFQRGGFPVTLLQMEGPISPDEQEKVESWWNSLIAGVKRAFRAVLVTNKIKPTQIGSSIKDTTAPELYEQSARNVAIAYGIPLSLLMSDAANYATALEDHVRFYTETVIPIYNRMAEVWNERVFEPQGVELICQSEELEVMQQYEIQKATALVELVGGPVLTQDEAREIMGYEPIENTAPPAQEAPQDAPAVEDDIVDDTIEIDAAAKDWTRFERKAHNALSAGKSAAVSFASDVLLAVDVDATTKRLAGCATHDDIAATFAQARRGGFKAGGDALLAEAVAQLKRANDLLESGTTSSDN